MSEQLPNEFARAVDAVCREQGWKRDGATIELDTDAGAARRVALEPIELDDELLVRVAAPVGPSAEVDALHLETALRLNYGLPHGALALHGEQLALVDMLLADDPDREEIEAVVRYLAEAAEQFERTIFGADEV